MLKHNPVPGILKKLPQFAVIFLFIFLIYGCGRQENPSRSRSSELNAAPEYGDAIVVSSIADARTLVPILASDSASGQVCGMIFNGLVKYDKDLILVGDLAQSWEILEDGLVIVFHLRHGVKWHDGTEFTARDVEFTYQKLIDPNVRTPYSGDFEKVQSLEVIDDHTVKIRYKEAFAPALASWGMNVMPRHLLEKEDLNRSDFARRPIGTGPYRFREWKTQEKIVLDANPDYFEGRPYIDRYIFRVIPDSATMFLELQNFGVDFMGLSPLQFKRQTETDFFKKNFRKFQYQGFSFTYLGYNLTDPKFADARVRKAINLAVDKQEIIDGVLLGLGSECTGPFARRSWAYNENVRAVPFDPQAAQVLMGEAGWHKNKQGFLEKDGRVFEFTIVTNQGNEERKRAAEIIQKRLEQIGMKVKIKVLEWSAFINEFINKRKFEAVLLGWSLSFDPDIYDIWHSSKTKEGEFNFINYANAEVDGLLDKARKEFSLEKRKEYYQRIHEIIYDEQPYLFLYNPDSLPIVDQRFENIKVEAAGISYNFIEWFVPKSRQRYQIN